MILCIGTTPAAQRVMSFNSLQLDQVNRAAITLDGIAGKSINVAKVLKTLDANPIATGFLGGPRGEEIRRVLREKGIDSEFITVPAPTRQCVTVIDQSAGTITELVEESHAVETAHFDELLALIRRRLPGCSAMVMSGTIAPGGPARFYRDCVELAREFGAKAIVDAQGAGLTESLSAGPALVKPNRQELARTVGCALLNEVHVFAAMRQLQDSGAQRVVVTAGKDSVFALDINGLKRIQPPRVRAINPIGSGDAFTAGLAWSLSRADDLDQACRWGAAAGAANALSLMPGELELQDVRRLESEVAIELIRP